MSTRWKKGGEKTDRYATITDALLKSFDQGVVPWHRPWRDQVPAENPVTGTVYQGMNRVLLATKPRERPFYVTFKQAKEAGGNVKAGAKGTPITYWNFSDVRGKGDAQKGGEGSPKEAGDSKKVPFMRYYYVFNIDDCEGLDKLELPDLKLEDHAPGEQYAKADEVVAMAEENICPIAHGGSRAYYSPSEDKIMMPVKGQFETPEEYYSTNFHEIAHATGAEGRLSRFGKSGNPTIGSPGYAKEELVAEIAACFLRYEARIDAPKLIAQSASYIEHYREMISKEPQVFISAANAATRAANFAMGRTKDQDAPANEELGDLTPRSLEEEKAIASALSAKSIAAPEVAVAG